MEKKQITNEEALGKIDNSYAQLEDQRGARLDEIRLTQDIKTQAQTKERERLVQKYGENHPRVKKIDKRLNYNQGYQPVMKTQVAYTRKKIPPIGTNSWRVHGRVLKPDGLSPVQGLTVSLFDEQGKWIRELGYDCSDENGFYSITYDPKKDDSDVVVTGLNTADFRTNLRKEKDGPKLFLTVTDNDKEIIHTEEEPVIPEPGQIDFRDIVLSEEACPPPVEDEKPGGDRPPGSEDEKPPNTEDEKPEDPPEDPPEEGRQIVLAQGKISDKETGKPLRGLTVHLLDKEKVYTEKLGTRQTGEEGNFEFRYKEEEIKEVLDKQPDILVMVTNKEGKQLYRSRKPFKPDPDKPQNLNLKINAS